MKKLLCIFLILGLLLPGCTPRKQVFEITYLDVFDTVTTIRGYETSQEAFSRTAAQAHEALVYYHRLFDIYHNYEGMNNLKTINDLAGSGPVAVDAPLLDLLEDCAEYCERTGGRMNIAMGSVLRLWHETREAGIDDPDNARLPDMEALAEAAKHCSMAGLILDRESGTVRLSDPLQSLDVGAVAKGWTAQRVSDTLPEGYLLNLGGNICVTGPKPDGSPWVVGVQDPDVPSAYLCTVPLRSGCTVTSGDYQRFFEVDGIRYHHIIDPDTLMPATLWHSVTILCSDSGLADCLSTALFLLPQEEGLTLAESSHAEVLWIGRDGNARWTEGFPISGTRN